MQFYFQGQNTVCTATTTFKAVLPRFETTNDSKSKKFCLDGKRQMYRIENSFVLIRNVKCVELKTG
jgi:hypothetical protein